MAKYRIDSIANLARQMEFTPQEARGAQVAAAEALLHTLDLAKGYPLDFVVFKITGYHPKRVDHHQLLAGIALQHDLGLLIEHVSDTLDVRTTDLAEPVLGIDDVTERFNVTSKTIQRWRRKGLPARRFVFPDGKRRVGFLISSVERFFAAHQDQVARGTNFSQVDDAERVEILRRARRLAEMCHCCANEISRRIGRKLNRSPATVLHTIRKHDAEHPDAAIFPHAAEPVADEERARIVRLFRRGLPIRTLARRTCRPRSAIYRIVLEERVAKLSKRKIKFIDDPLYHQDDAESAIRQIVAAASGDTIPAAGQQGPKAEDARVPKDLPPYLAALYRTPLLTPPRERALFLQFNFHKMQFVSARRRLDPQFARTRDLNGMEGHLRRATETKNEIVRANLRLVVSIARKHMRPGLSLMELVSDGNITLMRAVESFDVHKGNRFSTYATLALMKGFARSVPQMMSGRARGGAADDEVLAEVPDRRLSAATDRLMEREEVGQLLSQLEDRERTVLLAHFGLDEPAATAAVPAPAVTAPATYEQVGRRLGISKERVRQIEQTALAKLRAAAGSAA